MVLKYLWICWRYKLSYGLNLLLFGCYFMLIGCSTSPWTQQYGLAFGRAKLWERRPPMVHDRQSGRCSHILHSKWSCHHTFYSTSLGYMHVASVKWGPWEWCVFGGCMLLIGSSNGKWHQVHNMPPLVLWGVVWEECQHVDVVRGLKSKVKHWYNKYLRLFSTPIKLEHYISTYLLALLYGP